MCKHFGDERIAISFWNRVARRKRHVKIACVNEALVYAFVDICFSLTRSSWAIAEKRTRKIAGTRSSKFVFYVNTLEILSRLKFCFYANEKYFFDIFLVWLNVIFRPNSKIDNWHICGWSIPNGLIGCTSSNFIMFTYMLLCSTFLKCTYVCRDPVPLRLH